MYLENLDDKINYLMSGGVVCAGPPLGLPPASEGATPPPEGECEATTEGTTPPPRSAATSPSLAWPRQTIGIEIF